ncbi:hypothetical protein KR044_007709 [Drosophila immigrans]|nr:hypothetical protein KR044_007709 [Drosophila immigrans]
MPDGYHRIKVEGMESFPVLCNSTVTGSGWTVIHKRTNSRLSFNQTFQAYSEGFGNLRDDFFIGLNKLHLMTKSQPHELFIDTIDWFENVTYGRYDNFFIDDKTTKFTLKNLGQFNGTLFDMMTRSLGMKFRKCRSSSCGWWRNSCAFL